MNQKEKPTTNKLPIPQLRGFGVVIKKGENKNIEENEIKHRRE